MRAKPKPKENIPGFNLSRETTAALKGWAQEQHIHLDILLRSISGVLYLKLCGISRNLLFEEYNELRFPEFVQKIEANDQAVEGLDWILSWNEHKEMLYFQNPSRGHDEETGQRYTGYLDQMISQILETPGKKISEIEIIPGEEKRKILYDFNCSAVPYPWNKTIHQRFEEQAEKRSTNTAVIKVFCHVPFDQVHLTYSELNNKANRLARLLRNLGVQKGTAVGIMMDRSLEMIESLWAILKAGGTYLPINPDYPEAKISFMLEQAKAEFLLTQTAILGEKSFRTLLAQQECILVDRLEKQANRVSLENLESIGGPEDLVYINFIFDSTGKSRCAGIYHHNFMNLMHWFIKEFHLNSEDRNLLVTPLNLDITQKNLYAPMMTGGALCIPAFDYFEPAALLREVRENWVTWINCTPSMFYQLVEYDNAEGKGKLSFLKYIFLGDEPVSLDPFWDWWESGDYRLQVVNTYGPGECADVCTFYRIPPPPGTREEPIPIGKPVYNVELYVLDKNLKPVPLGVPGELYIGGEGVGGGYIYDQESTNRKFILHSFEEGKSPELLYRTGDIVKWRPDGNLDLLGRIEP